MSGEYVALSHCWGPRENRPLVTDCSNLSEHLKEIPWAQLPKTFQEAIIVVRNIGIQFLWIDSLCILQDDENEWETECKRMGAVYENASLTIAASHSPSSQTGLFLEREPLPAAVELPVFSSRWDSKAKVFATTRTETAEDSFPERGALNQRAWATQEWLLARRIIFFTKGQLIWSCKTLTQSETGEKCYSTARNPKWKSVIEQYSQRKLTVATDRLIALEGLRRAVCNDDSDTYLNGLWRNAMPDQLLWQAAREVREPSNPLQLPSWTWAALPIGVKFMPVNGAKSLCEAIFCGDKGELVIRAKMQRLFSVHNTRREGNSHQSAVTDAMADDFAKSNVEFSNESIQYIYGKGGSEGWITFDLAAVRVQPDQLFCSAVMGSVSRKDEEKEQRLSRVISNKLRHYWVLVLRQSADTPRTYERVGVGKTYAREWWADEIPQDISLA